MWGFPLLPIISLPKHQIVLLLAACPWLFSQRAKVSGKILPNGCFKCGTIFECNYHLIWAIYKLRISTNCVKKFWKNSLGSPDGLVSQEMLTCFDWLLASHGQNIASDCLVHAHELQMKINQALHFHGWYCIDFIMHQIFQNISGFLQMLIFTSFLEPLADRWAHEEL